MSIDSIVLDGNGLTVTNPTLTLPAALTLPSHAPVTLGGQITIGPGFNLSGSLSAGPLDLPFGYCPVHAAGVTLGTTGMVVSHAACTLNGPIGGLTLSADLTVAPNYELSGTLTASNGALTYGGFTGILTSASLSSSGAVALNGVQVGLSPSLSDATLQGDLQGQFAADGSFSLTKATLQATGAHLRFNGFLLNVPLMTLDSNGLAIPDATLTLPTALTPAGAPPTVLHGALAVSPALAVTGQLTASPAALSYNGFAVTARSVQLDDNGLTVTQAVYTLPGGYGCGGTISADLKIDTGYNVSGALDGKGVCFSLGGLKTTVDDMSLDSSGVLRINSAHASLSPLATGTISGSLTARLNGGSLAVTGNLSVAGASVTVGGYGVQTALITLGSDGFHVQGASITLPDALTTPGHNATVLNGDLSIVPAAGGTQVSANLQTTGPVYLSYNGFDLQAADVTFSTDAGLTVDNARYTLPAALGGATLGATVGATLHISPSFAVSGRLFVDNAQFVYGGFKASVGEISLDSDGVLRVSNAQTTLPGVSDTVLQGDLTARFSGGALAVSGALTATNTDLTYAGFALTVDQITLSNAGVSVDGARLTLPAVDSADGTSPIELEGNLRIAANGSGGFDTTGDVRLVNDHVSLSYYGFTVDVGDIDLSNNGLNVGAATLHVPDGFVQNLSSSVTVSGIGIDRNFHVTGGHISASTDLSFDAFGGHVAAHGLSVDDTGIRATTVDLQLPAAIGGAGDGYRGGAAVYVPRPRPGIWHVTVGNVHGGEGYHFFLLDNPAPTVLSFAAPRADQVAVSNPRTVISGTLSGAGPDDTVSLYYVTAPTVTAGGATTPNYAGQPIAQAIPVHDGQWNYRWETGALPAGRYDVYGVVNNGLGPLVQAFAPGAVQVVQPAHPGAPRAVTTTQSAGVLHVSWAPPVSSGNVAGYALYWRAARYRREAASRGSAWPSYRARGPSSRRRPVRPPPRSSLVPRRLEQRPAGCSPSPSARDSLDAAPLLPSRWR